MKSNARQTLYTIILLLSMGWLIVGNFATLPLSVFLIIIAALFVIEIGIYQKSIDLRKADNEKTLKRLKSKFDSTEFLITKNDKTFIRDVAFKFVDVIYHSQKKLKSAESVKVKNTRIGFVCGPMVYNMLDYLTRNNKLLNRLNISTIQFVAMNKAGESNSYFYSANYLVAAFSLLFSSKSKSSPLKDTSIAYTNNPYNQNLIDNSRQKIDILFCSISPIEGDKQSYIAEWLTSMSEASNQLGNLYSSIGDFCLIPINTEGYAVGSEEFKSELKNIIDPYPNFDWIGEVKRSAQYNRPKIILPIQTDTTGSKEVEINNHVYKITKKELIAKTILKSGIVDLCILNKSLAENLSLSLGFFLLIETSKLNTETRIRRCKAFSFTKNTEVTILAYDPFNRLEKVCNVNEKELKDVHEQPRHAPELIISEIPNAENHGKHFIWSTGVGIFNLDVYGKTVEIEVDKHVRKPGQWALITYYAVKNALTKFPPNLGKATIWDMGCGSGVVGILAAINEGDKISKILFSDINMAAVSCAKKNTKKHDIKKIINIECEQGSLFEPAKRSDQKFDIIAFNPPFFPNSMLTHGAENDGGGDGGWELAKKYCDELYNYLEPNGTGILTIADYVDNRMILKSLQDKFGISNIIFEDRLILYPTKTEFDIPLSYEVQKRHEIEEKCNYHFEICVIDNVPFYACNIRSYIAVKKLI